MPWSDAYEDRSSTAFEAALHLGLIGGVAGVDPVGVGRFLLGVLGFGEAGWFDDEAAEPEPDFPELGGILRPREACWPLVGSGSAQG